MNLTIPVVVARSTRIRSSEKILYAAFLTLGPVTAVELGEAIGAPPGAVVSSLRLLATAGLLAENTAGYSAPPIPADFYREAGVEPPILSPESAPVRQVTKLTSSTVEAWFQSALVARYGSAVQFTPFSLPAKTQAKEMLKLYGPGSVQGMVQLYVRSSDTPTWNGLWFGRERWNRQFQEIALGRRRAAPARVHDDEYVEKRA